MSHPTRTSSAWATASSCLTSTSSHSLQLSTTPDIRVEGEGKRKTERGWRCADRVYIAARERHIALGLTSSLRPASHAHPDPSVSRPQDLLLSPHSLVPAGASLSNSLCLLTSGNHHRPGLVSALAPVQQRFTPPSQAHIRLYTSFVPLSGVAYDPGPPALCPEAPYSSQSPCGLRRPCS